uniref:HTH CENPB-type domain-containing protein n=1 Tax=Erpetoichthys calabaricus TaxID=27687 RepID=A0A8C4RZL7_ERPCA
MHFTWFHLPEKNLLDYRRYSRISRKIYALKFIQKHTVDLSTGASYPASFKLKVIQRAEETNNCVAGREFCVSEKLVRDWVKNKPSLQAMPKSKKALRFGLSPFSGLEKDLNDWIVECRQNGYIVTRSSIRLRALQLAKEEKYLTIDGKPLLKFQALAGWCTRFMNRYGLCLRQRTKIAQKLPKDLEEKVSSFHKFIIKQRQRHDFDLSNIGNMDETPMTFDMPGNRTVSMDGTKLRPTIIFKRKSFPKNIKFPAGNTVRVHPKGWMNEAGTKLWLQDVWARRSGAGQSKRPSLLVWDMFRAHTSEDIKDEARKMATMLAVIPGGLTSMLQPLDVCLNKPFKDRVRSMWQQWMCSGEVKLTKGGNLKKPDIDLVAKWVKEAWDSIPAEMIKKSFLKCGISNAMDGSEDDAIYEDKESAKCTRYYSKQIDTNHLSNGRHLL